jgi:hypothetical protein
VFEEVQDQESLPMRVKIVWVVGDVTKLWRWAFEEVV